ncbi:MAG: hypothetical protein ACE5O2_06210 [Armatimonadota bacterium]
MLKVKSAVAGAVIAWALGPTCGASGELTGAEILQRSLAQWEHVTDFTAIASVHMRLQDSDLPDNRARVYWKQPDKFRIEPLCGIVAIPREALAPARLQKFLRENADVRLLDVTESARGKTYALLVRSRTDRDLGRLRVWINGANWTLTRMEAYEAEGARPVLTLRWRHSKVDGRHWMPTRIACEIDRPAGGGHGPLKGFAEIVLSDYRVNANLPDSVFDKPPPSRRHARPRMRRWR